jgi:outer membrane protein assembly factor BamB
LGQGYAGPAVQDGRVVVFHRVQDQERVEALDAEKGTVLWSRDFPATYRGGVDADLGPRCVPLIANGRVYVFGAAGRLHCAQADNGKILWSRDLYGDYQGQEGYFGAGSCPVLVGDRLLVNVGGRHAGIVAVAADTGQTLWVATEEAASYSSPTTTQLGDHLAVIFVTRLNALAIDPRDGRVLFRFPFGRTGPTVNAATPLVFDQHLFVSASYGVGGRLVKLSADGAELLWNNEEAMASQYTTCVYHDGHLYGAHGRADYNNGELRCLEARTGQVVWAAPEVGVAHTIAIQNQLLVLNAMGQLFLLPASPRGFQPQAQASLTSQTVRALPAVADGYLYFRDQSARGGKLYAVKL